MATSASSPRPAFVAANDMCTLRRVGSIARVMGHVVGEKVRRRPPVEAGDVPRSADDITPRRLTQTLCAGHPFYGFLVVVGASRLLPRMQPRAACDAIIGRAANAIVDFESLDALGV